ncbi:MAG: enolase C-terminal domain-like protein, partial [Solirubrobacteraceae bacterium]
ARPAADAICLKIARCGGISGTIETAARARAIGYDVYLASTLDGPLGIAGALHAAAVIRPSRASGLATLGLFADRADPLPALRGSIVPPDSPGLGEHLRAWY